MMKKLSNVLVAIAIILAFAACDRGSDAERLSLEQQERYQDSVRAVQVQDSIAAAEEARRPKTVQESLKEDARLARTMPLQQFARHMKAREGYYKQFDEVKYEDDFVKIKIEDDKMKIETPEGKAKFEEDETKIKTDTYKKKVDLK